MAAVNGGASPFQAHDVKSVSSDPKAVVDKLDFSGLDLTKVEKKMRTAGLLLTKRFNKILQQYCDEPIDALFDTYQSRHPHIKEINLSRCTNIAESKRRGLGYSLRHFQSLESLDLSYSDADHNLLYMLLMSCECSASFPKPANLKRLNLTGCHFEEWEITQLKNEHEAHPTLEIIH